MTTIVIDGLNEEDFRRSIQNRLREGKLAPAIARLRALLAPFAQAGGMLPERLLTVTAGDLVLTGWDALAAAVSRHDRPGRPVNAVSIAFGWAGEEVPEPDAQGQLKPHLETGYFNDDAFPFSLSSRDDLLEGYSFDGCTWSGDPEATDTALGVEGIDDLYGALALLEARLLASDEPDAAGLSAGSLGACLLSALLIEAVTRQIERGGVPRPLCVTAGSNGVYPYFDAPVVGMSAEVLTANAAQEDLVVAAQGVPVPRYSSLLVTSIPRARKRAVLVLEESDDDLALRLAGLRDLNHPERQEIAVSPQIVPETPAFDAPSPVLAPVLASVMAPADGALLLARKPAKVSADFRDMLGPRDSDLQQRLQSLLAANAPAAPAPAWVPPCAAAPGPVPDWPAEPDWPAAEQIEAREAHAFADELDEAPLAEQREGRWSKLKGWLSRLAPRRFG